MVKNTTDVQTGGHTTDGKSLNTLQKSIYIKNE
jgi:hypothetical protein